MNREQILQHQYRYNIQLATFYLTVLMHTSCQSGFQPIHLAAKYGQLEMLRLLVQKYRVDPNTPVIVRTSFLTTKPALL